MVGKFHPTEQENKEPKGMHLLSLVILVI